MKATQVLVDEHDGVKTILRVLEKIIQKKEFGEEVNTQHLKQILEFLQVFVDKCHHGKEEDFLIPEAQKFAIDNSDGLIEQILKEHEEGRRYVRGIKEGIENNNIELVFENGKKYIALLNSHIDRENTILFPRCDKVLNEEDQERLYQDFEKVEEERIGVGKHELFHKMIDELKAIYLQN